MGYINCDSLSSNDINELKYKILLLNNLYDITMKFFDMSNNKNKKEKNKKYENKNNINDKEKEEMRINLLNKFFEYFINSFEKKEFSFLLKNTNDEIGMILTFHINCTLNIINYIYKEKKNYDFNNILNIIENDLINIPLDYSIKTKDLLFIYSNFYFSLYLKLNQNDEKNMILKSEELFKNCLSIKSYEVIFSYMKGAFCA